MFKKYLKRICEIYNIGDAATLAAELAKRTRFLRDEVIIQELREENETGKKRHFYDFYNAFQKHLIPDLTPQDFADLYAQTITYVLFAARTSTYTGTGEEFKRENAFHTIPHTIGILRDIFRFISLGDLSKQMEWIVDDISEVLAAADITQILEDFYRQGKGKDLVFHFYETFLSRYDPVTREKRGVYYTPETVVSYIVRSLDLILKEKFAKTDGFSDTSVQILDPAAGTMTFLVEAARTAITGFIKKYGDGAKENFIREHILKNFYGFELMMAPYAVGHLKISFLLEEFGCHLKQDERFNLYLTNTLEMKALEQAYIPGIASLSEESRLAGIVKKETPILVILGNPPYYGHSSNRGEWIDDLLKKGYEREDGSKDDGYYRVDDHPLGERNPKWLQDDYVKFLRFAQWKIDNAGAGVVGMITNHGYLDNPTFRGMRQSLQETFDEIYVLDLHGNINKREKCPDGSKDENVFDIRQGVAIALFIKKGRVKTGRRAGAAQGSPKAHSCEVFHSEQWGLREEKYEWLTKNDISTTPWKKTNPRGGMYFFVPVNEELEKCYLKFMQVTELFPLSGVGITTARDEFVMDRDKKVLLNRILRFKNDKGTDDELHLKSGINKKKGWSIRDAWKELREIPDNKIESHIVPVSYRPFDRRWIFYHDAVVWRTAKRVMLHMSADNLGLITARSNKSAQMDHFFCTNLMMETKCGEATTQSSLFPLYLYFYPIENGSSNGNGNRNNNSSGKNGNGSSLFKDDRVFQKRPNIASAFLERIAAVYSVTPSPEEIFYYIYAVFYSNIYREKYSGFLRTDFPRVPFSKDYDVFIEMGRMGKNLVDLHLLESQELDSPVTRYRGEGDDLVKQPVFQDGHLYINPGKYFENIPAEVYSYQVGGYRVLDKWLKERKGTFLNTGDIIHFCRVVTALQKTIAIQEKIDELYPSVENALID